MAAGLGGTALVLLVWASTRDGDPRRDPSPTTEVGASAPGTTAAAVPGGRVVVRLVAAEAPTEGPASTSADEEPGGEEAEDEAPVELVWEVDLAAAAGLDQSAVCGLDETLRLAVVDRSVEEGVAGVTFSGPPTALAGRLLAAEGDDVAVQGQAELVADGGELRGELRLADDAGDTWTGTFRCAGPS